MRSDGARCWACRWTGATGRAGSPSGCSTRGPPSRPARGARRQDRRDHRAGRRAAPRRRPVLRHLRRADRRSRPRTRGAVAEATQRIAAWLERSIEAAPEQWYSFKPIWPDDPAEARAPGRAGGGVSASDAGDARRPAAAGARSGSGTRVQRIRARGVTAASSARAADFRSPLLVQLADAVGSSLVPRRSRDAPPSARANLRRVCTWLAAEGMGPARARRRRLGSATRSRPCSGRRSDTRPATTSRSPATPYMTRDYVDGEPGLRRAGRGRQRVRCARAA